MKLFLIKNLDDRLFLNNKYYGLVARAGFQLDVSVLILQSYPSHLRPYRNLSTLLGLLSTSECFTLLKTYLHDFPSIKVS